MEDIHVFFGRNCAANGVVIIARGHEAPGLRQRLDEDPMHRFVRVELFDDRKQVILPHVGGQSVFEGVDADARASFLLVVLELQTLHLS